MKKQRIGFIFLFLICLLMPSVAIADLSIVVVNNPGPTYREGSNPYFLVEVRVDEIPAPGHTVTFSIAPNDGNISFGHFGDAGPTDVTGSNGRAGKTFKVGDSASGTYTITASSGTVSVSRTVTVGTAPSLSVSVSSSASSASPGNTVTFTATVTENSNPASGQALTFGITRYTGTSTDIDFIPVAGTASLSSTSATTDSNGQASTSLTLGSGASGSYAVSATLSGGQLDVTSVTVEGSSSPPPTDPNPDPPESPPTDPNPDPPESPPTDPNPDPLPEVVQIPQEQRAAPDGSFDIDLSRSHYPRTITPAASMTFTVKVQEDGRPVSGQTVTFSVTPDAKFTADEFASLSPTSATTDSNGQAQTTLSLTGDTSAHQYVVWAKLDNGQSDSYSVPVGVASGGAELSLAIDNLRTYRPGESVGFTFWLHKGPTGVSGETVTFSVSPNDGTASLSSTSATTDSNGEARTKLILGSNASGKYRVTATLDDGKSVSNGPPTVHNSKLPSGFILGMLIDDGAFPLNPGERRTFTAIVQKDGSYVSGQTVTFSVSPNDGTVSLSSTSATTGSDGRASTSLITGSGSSGTYTVTATLANGQSISGTSTVGASSPTPDTPDLFIDALTVNKNVLDAGESFTISADVKNQGGGSSSTATLTYYQYFDDKSAEKVGESDIASLAAGETTDLSITLTAPETSGTHSYYACVSTHCASTVKISVRSETKELVISSGDNQTGTPNNDLPNPISVQVLGEDGIGVPRVLVVFRVVSGTARMRRAGGPKRSSGASAWTDNEGYAKAYVTPTGTEPIRIRASVDGLDPVVFTVNPEQAGGAPSAWSQSNVTALLANYPNPFNPETWIPYRLAKASEVVVAIFASNGQVVRRLELGHQSAGIYYSRSRAAYWDGKNESGEPVASGVYFYTFTAGNFTATRKMLILK